MINFLFVTTLKVKALVLLPFQKLIQTIYHNYIRVIRGNVNRSLKSYFAIIPPFVLKFREETPVYSAVSGTYTKI